MNGLRKPSAFAAALVFFAASSAAAQDASSPSPQSPTPAAPGESVSPPDRPAANESARPAPQADKFLQKLNRRGAEDRAERGGANGDSTAEGDSDPLPLSMISMLLRGVGATALVLGLIVLFGYLARRFGRKSPLLAGVDLGSVMGRVYLAKGASLYYVRTGGRILVIGVTNNAISLVSEFDATAFGDEEAEPESKIQPESAPDAFLSQLRSSTSAIRSAEEGEFTGDMEVDSLKGDIRRLQSLIEEESRETRS